MFGDYWEELENKNPEFKLNRRAYSLYCQSGEYIMGFNAFCESEKYRTIYLKLLREKKLERILKYFFIQKY